MGKSESEDEASKGQQDEPDLAVARLFERHAQRLAHLAERHLSRELSSRVDGEDVVQSVFRTFFRRCSLGEFKIDSSAQIWQLLAKITLLKARAVGRFHTAEKRDVGFEARSRDAFLKGAVTREPGPAEAVALVDQIEVLVRDLPPLYRDLLELRLRGFAVSEIAQELSVSRRTVQRALNLLQERLSKAAAEIGG
jgi:RNA polymerase sigma-70 factor, ECF subfamily